MDAMTEIGRNSDKETDGFRLSDSVVWAICPHIRRWSDSNFHEYALQHQACDRCPQSESIDGYELVCPWRCDAEEAAKAVLRALAEKQGQADA